jgi:hypothetical protein
MLPVCEKTCLFQSTARGFRVEAVDDDHGDQVEDGVDVETAGAELAKDAGSSEGDGTAANAPAYNRIDQK